MPDRVTEVTSRGWFSRIGSAFSGVLVGLIMIVIAFPLLFWNEGRAVDRAKALDEGASSVTSVETDSVNSANEGKLVHVSGTAQTDEALTDEEFSVQVTGLRLERTVEMYQWIEKSESETREELGGGEETVTTYTYSKGWSEGLNDSSRFHEPRGHQNPDEIPYGSRSATAEVVNLGAFTLNADQIGRAGEPRDVPTDSGLAVPEKERGEVKGSSVYLGANSARPAIGDVRATFGYVPEAKVSIIAQQTGGSFSPYLTSKGGQIDLIDDGIVSSEQMFADAKTENKIVTWVLRFAGFLVMFIGFGLVFRPLSAIADVVPFIGSIVGAGTGLIAFLLAAAGSFVTIAVAWIFYRPLIGIPLLLVGLAGAVFAFMRTRRAERVQTKPA